MCKFNLKNDSRRIDPCMVKVIDNLQVFGKIRTLACCCGHGKYPMTLVIDIGLSKRLPLEIFSGKQIERKKKFYKKDKQGYYYIPEVMNALSGESESKSGKNKKLEEIGKSKR